jgi:predicted transcriptional regulator YdeE
VLCFVIALIMPCLMAAQSSGGTKVKTEVGSAPKIVEAGGFTVVGIAARTSNAKEVTPEGIIGQQWARLYQEGILAQIPHKADSNVIALYTDYASDENGEYTYLLGAKVTSAEHVPAGMVAKQVPAGRYAVFTTDKGPVQQVIPQAWARVWATPKSDPAGKRAYRADFELHDQRAADPQNSVVDIYVGVR